MCSGFKTFDGISIKLWKNHFEREIDLFKKDIKTCSEIDDAIFMIP